MKNSCHVNTMFYICEMKNCILNQNMLKYSILKSRYNDKNIVTLNES
jgi:hypothetical protein